MGMEQTPPIGIRYASSVSRPDESAHDDSNILKSGSSSLSTRRRIRARRSRSVSGRGRGACFWIISFGGFPAKTAMSGMSRAGTSASRRTPNDYCA